MLLIKKHLRQIIIITLNCRILAPKPYLNSKIIVAYKSIIFESFDIYVVLHK